MDGMSSGAGAAVSLSTVSDAGEASLSESCAG